VAARLVNWVVVEPASRINPGMVLAAQLCRHLGR
jgi:hypothetical protein